MAFEEDLTTALLADSGLAAAIGTRLSWIMRNRGEDLPAVTLTLAASGTAYHHGGATTLQSPRIQFDIWGATQLQVVQVRRLLTAALHALTRTTVGATAFKGAFLVMAQDWTKQERGEGDPDSRSTVHFNIWHQPAA